MTTELTDDHAEAAARLLADSAMTRRAVDTLGVELADLASGYRVQDSGHGLHDDPLVGWKVGCTSSAAQKFLSIDEPVTGRYRTSHVVDGSGQISATDFVMAPHLEVEVGFRLLADVDGAPSDSLLLADAVEAFVAIEVVASRFAAFPMLGGPMLVADNVAGARMIVGPALALDAAGIRALDTAPLTLTVDGVEVAAGTGAEALGHPLTVLAWLAGHATARGIPLRAGELVITGTCTGLTAARAGETHVGRAGDSEVSLAVV